MSKSQSCWNFFSFERIVSNIAFLLWVVVLLGVIVYRAVAGVDNSTIFTFFTNWSWIFQTIFYTIDYIGRLLMLCRVKNAYRIRFYNAYLLFWFINGTVWLVLILVTIIIQENPQLLINAADDLGGLSDLGEVVNAHILIHYVPGFMVLLFLALERDLIGNTIIAFFGNSKHATKYATFCNGLYVFYITVFIVAFPFVIYSIIFDPRQIYGFTLNIGVLILISLAVIFIFNVMAFVVMLEVYVHGPKMIYDSSRRRWVPKIEIHISDSD